MDQLIINPKDDDIDPSIKVLARTNKRKRALSEMSIMDGKKFHYVPIYPQLTSDHLEIDDYEEY